MKNKEQNFTSTSIEPLMMIEDLLESIDIFTMIEDTLPVKSSNSFYNTVVYGFNYALEVIAPLAKNICEYFAGTSQNIEDNLHVPNMGDAPELWDSFTSYSI
ncbi:hypothetical protein [Rickettsia bellii]|uniref:Uncharacterized protein n=3 Tax=Rickettsia bellii TaxID=33990 RepID=Q1RKH1_RICBR|nr:hypothetical protein [Rickettsia bellii]ABE04143.1 unknown [Rickettsia bellii RML369-C]ABV78518.1 hypothetical protein A1I_00580 [Rickettsia bellii OSU 85-389]